MTSKIERRIAQIAHTQMAMFIESKKILHKHCLGHSYCDGANFTLPSEWVCINTMISSKELLGFAETEILNAINYLVESSEVILSYSGAKFKSAKDW